MRLEILGNRGGVALGHYSTCGIIDDSILLDAGTGYHNLSVERAISVSDVMITHCHLDHTVMLPFLSDFVRRQGKNLRVHCLEETANAIRRGLFNDEIWPNMEKIIVNGKPLIQYHIIKPYEPFEVEGRKFTALPVDHKVPTVGYCMEGDYENFVYFVDIYEASQNCLDFLNNLKNFRQICLEVSFPNHLEEIAKNSSHLTPNLLLDLISKLPPDIQIYYSHVKPQYLDSVTKEMISQYSDRVKPLKVGDVIEF